MPTTISIKHANHKIFPVTPEKKLELLQLLLSENQDKSIVIFSNDITLLEQAALTHPNLALLSETTDTSYDIVISYEIAVDAQNYLQRVAKATINAFALLLESEQNALYPIEVILGRTIKQEIRDGFGYPQPEPKEEKTFKKTEYSKDRKPFDKDRKPFTGERKPYDKDKKPFDGERKPYDKDKKPYSGERKPFDKDRKSYDGEKKPYDKDKKPYDGERKSYSDEKKPYSSEKKPFSHDKKSYDMSKKKSNNFLGYDENGKAMFAGKSGDRNHKYDGSKRGADDIAPKKTGKTFMIKELKKKEKDK
ncbi:MAG: hypothetical protein RBR59_03440 [Sulfurimonadaceae bacterium]|jgi:hypothetical protein|nr:hypothetical protein [Sulfurimonadaceae bacterium]